MFLIIGYISVSDSSTQFMEFGVGYSHHITWDQDFVKQLCWLHLAAELATLQVSEHFLNDLS